MLIRSVKISNFGPYRGSYDFDLTIENDDEKGRPLVLFTGRNGAGKSSLFQAISVCLYGPYFRGVKIKNDEYECYLIERIASKNPEKEVSEGVVTLELQYSERGIAHRMRISRSWTLENGTLSEQLSVVSNTEEGNSVKITYPQEFLLNLLPAGLSQLLFFDGEEVNNLAGRKSPTEILKDGFQTLLGIDIVEQLRKDLRRYSYWLNEKDVETDSARHEEIESEIEEAINQKQEINDNLANIEERTQELQSQVTETELKLSKQGSEYAEYRGRLRAQEKNLEAKKEDLQREINDLFSGTFPFAFAPDLCEDTIDTLMEESNTMGHSAVSDVLSQSRNELTEAISSDSFWESLEVRDSDRREFSERVLDRITRELSNPDDSDLSHKLSPFDTQRIVSALREGTQHAIKMFQEKVLQLNNTVDELKRVREDLSRVPSDRDLQPLVRKLQGLMTSISKLERKKEIFLEQIDSISIEIENLKSQQEKALDELKAAKKHSRKIALAKKARNVADSFRDEFAKKYMELVGTSFEEIYNEMRPEEKELKGVEVDPSTFEITLIHKDGRRTKSAVLSTGEKQIYSFALLGAILKLAKRPMPVFIDAPFTSLDQGHRDSVISEFIPIVGNQVVMFATETEVTESVRNMLDPLICREIHLELDSELQKTIPTIRRGPT